MKVLFGLHNCFFCPSLKSHKRALRRLWAGKNRANIPPSMSGFFRLWSAHTFLDSLTASLKNQYCWFSISLISFQVCFKMISWGLSSILRLSNLSMFLNLNWMILFQYRYIYAFPRISFACGYLFCLLRPKFPIWAGHLPVSRFNTVEQVIIFFHFNCVTALGCWSTKLRPHQLSEQELEDTHHLLAQ